ncbi:MAG: flagellar hook-length control protein FliK [Phycisphaerales bacterium JB064]
MPQQVLASHKAPDIQAEQRPQRERELRVQADAGAFGMLLGALQAGEAGIVRGEPRNDSAAEWNAKNAREGRQDQRSDAQASTPKAQEPRDPLARLASPREAQSSAESPTEVARQVREEPAAAPTRDVKQPKLGQPATPSTPEKGEAQAASNQPSAAQAIRTQAAAAVAPTAPVAQAGTSAGQPNQANTVTAAAPARGPQGGAARGKAPTQAPARSDQNLRFERVFEAQVSRGLAKALQSGDGSVTLRLRPQSLGQLSVRVHVEQNQVTATFEAHSAEAQRLLEGSRESLKQQLESRGLTVERIDVRLIEQTQESGTRVAWSPDGGADSGQDGQSLAHDRHGRGSPDGGAQDGSRGGAPRVDDEPSAGAEPWRVLGTVRLDAIG